MQEVAPELQAEYEDVVSRGLLFMYDKRVMPVLLESMRTGANPQEALGETGALLFARIDAAMREAGRAAPDELKAAAAAEIMANLGEMATEAGIYDFMQDNAALEGAWYLSMDRFRDIQETSGALTPQQAEENATGVQRMMQDGTLDQLLQQAGDGQPQAPAEAQQRGLMG
jgi:hypothetical protein